MDHKEGSKMANQQTEINEILTAFLEHCRRPAGKLVGGLDPDEDVWLCPADPPHALTSLAEAFSAEQLAECGLVDVHEDGQISLTPSLSDCSAPLIVLRDAETNEPFDLLTGGGCVVSDSLPVFEALEDARTLKWLEEGDGTLYVTFSLGDAIVCRACGLAATLAVGLETLQLIDIEDFCHDFGVATDERFLVAAEPKDASPTAPRPVSTSVGASQSAEDDEAPSATDQSSSRKAPEAIAKLAFVGWRLYRLFLALPRQIKVVFDHFEELQRYLGVDLWLPQKCEQQSGRCHDPAGIRYRSSQESEPERSKCRIQRSGRFVQMASIGQSRRWSAKRLIHSSGCPCSSGETRQMRKAVLSCE